MNFNVFHLKRVAQQIALVYVAQIALVSVAVFFYKFYQVSKQNGYT